MSKPGKFKPGQSGNPGGRPKLPADIAEARKLNQHELERVINQYIWMTKDELKAAAKAPTTTVMELMIASIVASAIEKGDQMRLEFILARIIGKVRDQLELTGQVPFVIKKRDGTEMVMGVKPEGEE